MYFYEEGECITNSESALSKPSSFAKEQDEKVVYFQNGCLTKIYAEENSFTSASMESSSITEPFDNVDEMGPDVSEEEDTEETRTSEMTAPPAELTTTDAETGTEGMENDEEYVTDVIPSDNATTSAEKLGKKGEKAGFLKYKKHPKNFASKTTMLFRKATQSKTTAEDFTNGDSVDDLSVHASSSSVEEEPNDSVHTIESSEPVEGQMSPFDETKRLHTKAVREKNDGEENEEFPTYFSEWSDWTACKKAGERQIRRRKCLNLRRCLGALMQLRNCPTILPEPDKSSPVESVRTVVDVPPVPEYDDAVVDVRPSSSTVPPEAVWSPWQGVCQHFVSAQPCNNGEMIGFESRECVAKEPSLCEGPFFRYCTLPC